MKISLFTDYRFATNPTPTGVSKHAYFMAKGLMADPRFQLSALVASDQTGRQGCLDFLPAARLPLPWKVARELWAVTNHPVADRWVGDADWVYCPKNDWIPVRKVKYAVTIHGANELDPAFVKPQGRKNHLLCARNRSQYLKMCARADVVFTVSEWLKNFVVEQFHADPKKIVVVGNGVDPVFYEAGRMKAELAIGSFPTNALPYVLCVGGLNYIDGGDRIIALGHEIQKSGDKIRIKVAGCQHEPETERLASETGVIDLLGYVPHEHLAGWMANASVFFYPTRYETFGMAAAEAMASGCPIVTSRCMAVPEIVGDCGLYIDPDKASETMEVVRGLESDLGRKHALIACARQRAGEFTWNACVERLCDRLLKQ